MHYETEQIILRPFTKEDITDTYLSWFIDPVTTQFNAHGLGPLTKEQAEQFTSTIDKLNHLVWAIIDQEHREHIGNVSLRSINYINRSAEFAIIIGDQYHWGKGIGFAAAKLVFTHGFDKLNLHRIWTGTADTNKGMKRIANKLGMIQEGIFDDGTYLNGKYVNVIAFGILKAEWNRSQKEV